MRLRAKIERYWSVWIFNGILGDGIWEPYEEGLRTNGAARKRMREAQQHYPNERLCIVRTTNERLA